MTLGIHISHRKMLQRVLGLSPKDYVDVPKTLARKAAAWEKQGLSLLWVPIRRRQRAKSFCDDCQQYTKLQSENFHLEEQLETLERILGRLQRACRQPSGQAMYLSYWQTSTLRHLLREALSMRRLAPIDERHVLWQKAWEWSAGLGFGLIWGIVERRTDGKTSPCCHCRKIRNLQLQNKQLHAKITETRQRIDDTIRKLQRCIANNSNPSPDITRELAKSQQALRQLEHSDFTA